jgi:PAB-dependent poly(A)-specific ribonuclease subunit 3
MSKTIDEFLRGISGHIITSFDSILHSEDTLTSELARELENGRIARLMMKLGTINERQEHEGDRNWSENGERYMLKLFRDYVFHQVDGSGNAIVDLGHLIRCLNRLDAGIDEKVLLTSRDEQTTFVVTYKELKKQVATTFGDLAKPIKPTRGF